MNVLQNLRDQRYHPRLYTQQTQQMEKEQLHNKTKFKQYLSTHPFLQQALEEKLKLGDVNNIPKKTQGMNYKLTKQRKGGPTSQQQNNGNQETLCIDNFQYQWCQCPPKDTDKQNGLERDISLFCIQETHLSINDQHHRWVEGCEKHTSSKWT